MKKRIVTVCMGNIERSVLAALFIQRELTKLNVADEYLVMSRGIQGMPGEPSARHKNLREYADIWPYAAEALTEFDIEWPCDQESTPMTEDIAQQAAIIYAMDKVVAGKLRSAFPEHHQKIKLFSKLADKESDVADPHDMKTAEGHSSVIREIEATVRKHITQIISDCGL
jgi:protein-tyrosine-phosphatase